MVHKATDGVPRLINQVCDYVLLLACAAGVRRIEPAHVEEAWADLQQLPTPWNAPTNAVSSDDSAIEFGSLDDAPAEMSPIAGKVPVAEDGSPEEAAVADPALAGGTAEDTASFEQLQHIQKLLADVQAEFQPVTTGPEVELVFETPHPFKEPFEQEEVVADRYAAHPAPTAGRAADAVPQAAGAAVAAARQPELATGGEPGEDRPSETIAQRRDCEAALEAGPTRQASAAGAATAARQKSPRLACSAAAPRQEFDGLFAKLRRGL